MLNPDIKSRTILVSLRKLDTILAKHAEDVAEIDVVSIDVEGWEMEVLQGFDIEKYKPKVLIVENLFNDPVYVESFASKGYRRWSRNLINDIYVRHGFHGTGASRYYMPLIEYCELFAERIRHRLRRSIRDHGRSI